MGRLLTTNNHVVAVLDQLDQPTLETKERNTDAKRTPMSDQAVPDSVSVVVPDAVAQPNKSGKTKAKNQNNSIKLLLPIQKKKKKKKKKTPPPPKKKKKKKKKKK